MPDDVRDTITRLCLFFNAICSKVFDFDELDALQSEAVLILCKLEIFFPPSFFDIMVHLIIHIVREIKYCGPVYLRWMYPVERYMKILKGYVKNLRRPEASIVQRYIAEEAIEWGSHYLPGVTTIGIPSSCYEGTRGIGSDAEEKPRDLVMKAHLCILNNTVEVAPYI